MPGQTGTVHSLAEHGVYAPIVDHHSFAHQVGLDRIFEVDILKPVERHPVLKSVDSDLNVVERADVEHGLLDRAAELLHPST